ncbi:MAG TPA: UdgX family uracil-DNA binding protein [Gemmatimonadaceae bacterium]|nr:UdgX family uracil-DNA binding protein [Gemmatimonadaceae bacterium]
MTTRRAAHAPGRARRAPARPASRARKGAPASPAARAPRPRTPPAAERTPPPGRPSDLPHPGSTAAEYIPPRPTLPKLRAAAAGCRACHLWTLGTQTVFGEGPRRAAVMLVGEQPGDKEDLAGHPFVGPSGRLLDEALAAAGIDRDGVYVTNVVKHFKWERGEKGKRRIHKTPNDAEIRACRPWLDAEIALVKPDIIVCLGATAAKALLGKSFRVTKERGRPVESPLARAVVATVHPSSVLRAPDEASRARAEQAFVADLKVVAKMLKEG